MKKINKKYGNKIFPRISIFRSNKEIYVQVIDDNNRETITSYSSLQEKKKNKKKMTKIKMSKLIGQKIAYKMLNKNIKKAFFDRNGYIYHGRIKILLDEIRNNGIKI
ncbi:MAG: 50S ribosomal protein L18 [Candidatus Shikimatogenerans bostrichidophilus]|nr:MAG: 50S ribosomal protein L18 [Candidatus Shikimatogenerans bostrichidophilus]